MVLAEQKQIETYTANGWWGTKTLLDYFKEHVANHPDRTALVDPLNREALTGTVAERISFKKLDQAVDAVATALIKKGLQPDDIVVVQLPNTWELAMLYLAIARAGGLISPVPLQWRHKELKYVCSLTDTKYCITVENFRGFEHAEMMRGLLTELPHLQEIITLDQLREMTNTPIDNQALKKSQLTQ